MHCSRVRCVSGSIVFAVILSGLGAIQGYSQDLFLVRPPFQVNKPIPLYLISDRGSIATLYETLPANVVPSSATVDEYNDGFLLTAMDYTTFPGQGVLLRLAASGLISTIAAGPSLLDPRGVMLDETGSVFVLSSPMKSPTSCVFFLSVHPNGTVTTVGRAIDHRLVCYGFDHESGHAVMLSYCSSENTDTGTLKLYRIDPRTGSVSLYTELSSLPFSLQMATSPLYEMESSSLVMATPGAAGNTLLLRISPENGVSVVKTITAARGTQVAMERLRPRSFESTYGLIVSQFTTQRLMLLSLSRDGIVKSSSPVSSISSLNRNFMTRAGSRHLTASRGPTNATHQFRVSFPESAGRPFVVGLSLDGVGPGTSLSDGRVIPINPDLLTILTMFGGIPGVMEHTAGYLDSAGRATTTIYPGPFGSWHGQRLSVVAVVVDPTAPCGIAEISQPLGYRLP